MAKKEAKAKKHGQAKLSLCENCSFSASTLSSKNNRRNLKNVQKTSAFIWMASYDKWQWNETENDHKGMTWIDLGWDMDPNILNIKWAYQYNICIKQYLSNIWSSIHENVKQHWGCVEKKALLRKKRVCQDFSFISSKAR